MKRMVVSAIACMLAGTVGAQSLQGRYFTPATLQAQMNRPNDQLALVYLMGTYDSTQDSGQSCAQRGTTTPNLLAKVFSDYLMAHPELLSADRTGAGVAAQAFRQYWPCQSASGQEPAASGPAIPGALDNQFVCPETLSNDQARRDAIGAELKSIAAQVPGATVLDALYLRRKLLEKHHCQQTLSQMAAAPVALQAFIDQGKLETPYWLPIPLSGLSGFAMGMSLSLDPFVDPRYPNEPAVSAYTKLTVTPPRVTSVTHTHYDTVVSHTIYYCASGRYALVENDFFLAGQRTLKDPSHAERIGSTDVYDIDSLPSNSPNAAAAQAACRAIGVNTSDQSHGGSGRYLVVDAFGAQLSGGHHQMAQIYLMGTYDLTQDAMQSCAQRGTTTPTLLEKVYSDYVSTHPEVLHTPRTGAGIAAQAFAQYWPCHS